MKKKARKAGIRKSRLKTARRAHKKPEKSGIEFCKKCGAIMLPEGSSKLKCRNCGYSVKAAVKELRIVEKKENVKGVIVLEKDPILLPVTERACPKCGNSKAYYWLQQTRSADEPPTQFFRCVKCKYVWREYK